jgi:hypothetical protein
MGSRLRKVSIGAIVLVLLSGPLSGPAAAQTFYPVIKPFARIEAGGAGVVIRVIASCPEDARGPGSVNVTLARRFQDRVVFDGGSNTLLCDATDHLVRIGVVPDNSGRPFTPGEAFVRASVNWCTFRFCFGPSNARAVTLVEPV